TFVSPQVPAAKVRALRRLGARVEVSARPEDAARECAGQSEALLLVVDGRDSAMAEGAGTIGVELGSGRDSGTAAVQGGGGGALITGIACWLKHASPRTRIVGVCASGAPAMAESFSAGKPVAVEGTGTIATALAITRPVPESVARVVALVDEIVLVDDHDLRV